MYNFFGFIWSCINFLNFWSISFAVVETLKTLMQKLDWIWNNIEGIWFYSFFFVALTLIRQFAVICMDVLAANVACLHFQDFLRFVLTFQDGFQDITLACKTVIFINENLLNLSQINLKIYRYKTDEDLTLPPHNKTVGNSPLDIPSPSVFAFGVFANVTIKNKTMYKQVARKKKIKI